MSVNRKERIIGLLLRECRAQIYGLRQDLLKTNDGVQASRRQIDLESTAIANAQNDLRQWLKAGTEINIIMYQSISGALSHRQLLLMELRTELGRQNKILENFRSALSAQQQRVRKLEELARQQADQRLRSALAHLMNQSENLWLAQKFS